MLVISDASPINVLIRIDFVDILPSLYGRVVIPGAVANELKDPAAPPTVRSFVAALPPWIEIKDPNSLLLLIGLGPGELAAISLAHEAKAELLLVDDKRGRRAAASLGIPLVGTLGILERAAQSGLIELGEAVNRLRKTDFKISVKLLDDALNRDAQRRK